MKYIKLIIASLFFISSFFLFSASANAAKDVTGWAWSSNIGWISFNCSNTSSCGNSNYKVTFATTSPVSGYFSGYAWSPSIGWVSFNSGDVSNCPSIMTEQVPCQAMVNLTSGSVTGWARAIRGVDNNGGWDGWIKLSGTNFQTGVTDGTRGITYNPADGILRGYSWGSEVTGWLRFSQDLGVPVVIPPDNNTGISCSLNPINHNSTAGELNLSWSITTPMGTTLSRSVNGAPYSTLTTIPSGTTSYTDDIGPVTSTTQYSYRLTGTGLSQCSRSITVDPGVVTNPNNGKLWLDNSPSMTKVDTKIRTGMNALLNWNVQDYVTQGLSCRGVVVSGPTAVATWNNKDMTLTPTAANGSAFAVSGLEKGLYEFKISCFSGMTEQASSNSVRVVVTSSVIEEQ